ncbi:hypothetical protein HUG17_3242 [Dermatophagoides farinae]|uniref:Uncharacterized protein n=1 Tax=Dermatophagoides farinae TaxID=6954 RepID=A0A9D4NV07_DERFA|nr:hypothetical protein HUG17_3242 [Dermatophagoides farinae]
MSKYIITIVCIVAIIQLATAIFDDDHEPHVVIHKVGYPVHIVHKVPYKVPVYVPVKLPPKVIVEKVAVKVPVAIPVKIPVKVGVPYPVKVPVPYKVPVYIEKYESYGGHGGYDKTKISNSNFKFKLWITSQRTWT